MAGSLARCLGEGAVSTLLVDADEEGGGLAAQLDVKRPEHGPVDVGRNVRFMELGPGSARDGQVRELVSATGSAQNAVVIDLGHQVGPRQRELAAASDWLIWVVMPDRSGLERADRAMGSRALTAAAEGLVLNRIRRGALADADRVLASRHGLPVMARINESAWIADRVASGRAAHRLRSVRRALAELARTVHPDAATAGPAWP